MDERTVLIIGGGVAGMAAAAELAKLNIRSVIVEKQPHLGGHGALYACKATESCVKCGACVVDEKMQQVIDNDHVDIWVDSQVRQIEGNRPYGVELEKLNRTPPERLTRKVDAIIVATGFTPFDPWSKPYGYEEFDNVITNLELECMLRQNSVLARPSDNTPAQRMAFFQCVGSRDAKLGHLWCSKICCASALRLSRLIQHRHPDTDITFFYIDVQTFGKAFARFYDSAKDQIRMVRTIPGDVYRTDSDRLKVTWYDAATREIQDELFDLIVLSVGITPARDNRNLAETLQMDIADEGFISAVNNNSSHTTPGVFAAGTACGPMSIADSVASAGQAAMAAAAYLRSLERTVS